MTSGDLVTLFRGVIAGEVSVSVVGESWADVWAGNVTFQMGAWRVAIFNDCGELDYVDSADGPGGHYEYADDDPIARLTEDEQDALLARLAAL